jgi:hypothetical protein
VPSFVGGVGIRSGSIVSKSSGREATSVGERASAGPISAMGQEEDEEGERLAGMPRKARSVIERMALFHQSSLTSHLIMRKECLQIAGGLYWCSGCV